MKPIVLAALALSILILGCCGQTPVSPAPSETGQAPSGGQNNTSGTGSVVPSGNNGTGSQQPTGDGTIVDVGGSAGTTGTAGKPAGSQEDCATMTPTCGACVAKSGCGWCKSRNGCFYGTGSGPASVACEDVNWATTDVECAAPVGGNTCGSKTNCADCLSGAGCKWCQIGTKCASADSTETCGSGGWRTTSYMCYAGQ